MAIRHLLRPIWTLFRIAAGVVIVVEGSLIIIMTVPDLLGFFDERATGVAGFAYHAIAFAPLFIVLLGIGLVSWLGVKVMGGIPNPRKPLLTKSPEGEAI